MAAQADNDAEDRSSNAKPRPFKEIVPLIASWGAIMSIGAGVSSAVLGFFTIQSYTRALKISYLRPLFFQYSSVSFFILYLIAMISVFMSIGSGIVAGYGQRHDTVTTSHSDDFLRRFVEIYRKRKWFPVAITFSYFISVLMIFLSVYLDATLLIIPGLIGLSASNFFLYFYRNIFNVARYVFIPAFFFGAFSNFLFALTFLPGTTLGYSNINVLVSLKVTTFYILPPNIISVSMFFFSRSNFFQKMYDDAAIPAFILAGFALCWISSLPFFLLPERLMHGLGIGYFQIAQANNYFCVAANVEDKMFLYPVRNQPVRNQWTIIGGNPKEISLKTFLEKPYRNIGTMCPPALYRVVAPVLSSKTSPSTPLKYPTGG